MANIILASSLSRFTGNRKDFEHPGGILNEVLSTLCKKNRELGKFIYKSAIELHPFVNIFVDNQNVRDLQGLETVISQSSVVRILPGISGG